MSVDVDLKGNHLRGMLDNARIRTHDVSRLQVCTMKQDLGEFNIHRQVSALNIVTCIFSASCLLYLGQTSAIFHRVKSDVKFICF